MCLRAARRWCSVDLVLGTMRLFESETAALREGVMTQLNMRANYEMGYTLDFLDDPLIPTAATRFDTALGKAGLIRRKYHILSTADIERVPLGEIYEVLNRVCTTQREVDNLSAVFIAKALHRISAAATLLSPRGFACLAALCFLNLAALVPSRQVTLAVKQAAYASYREMMMVAADRVTNDDTFLARLSVLSCARLLLGLQMSRIEADVVRAKLYGKIEEGVSIREYTIDTFMVCAYLHTVSGEVPKYVLQRMVEAFPIWDPDTFHASLPRILWYCMRCDLSLSDECLATFERMLLVNFHKTKGVTKFRNFFEKQRGWNGMLTSAMLHYRLSRREVCIMQKPFFCFFRSLRFAPKQPSTVSPEGRRGVSRLRGPRPFTALSRACCCVLCVVHIAAGYYTSELACDHCEERIQVDVGRGSDDAVCDTHRRRC